MDIKWNIWGPSHNSFYKNIYIHTQNVTSFHSLKISYTITVLYNYKYKYLRNNHRNSYWLFPFYPQLSLLIHIPLLKYRKQFLSYYRAHFINKYMYTYIYTFVYIKSWQYIIRIHYVTIQIHVVPGQPRRQQPFYKCVLFLCTVLSEVLPFIVKALLWCHHNSPYQYQLQ